MGNKKKLLNLTIDLQLIWILKYKHLIEVDIIFLGRKNLDDSNVSYQIVQVLNNTKIVGFLF